MYFGGGGGGEPAWGPGRVLVGAAGQEAGHISGLQNNHTDLHTNKQTQNPKERTFKTESSC